MRWMPLDEVLIESSKGSGFLGLHSPEFATPRGGALDYFTAELSVSTLRAELRVYAFLGEGLPRLFEDMAIEWRGWSGAKRWRSLEGKIELSATHDGLGRIGLLVVLSEPYGEWKAEGTVALEAGSLDTPARRLRDFVGT